MPVRYYMLFLSCMLLAACLGCSSSAARNPDGGTPGADVTAYFALPSPADVLHNAAATGGQHCDGADFIPDYNANVSAGGTTALFTPSWVASAPDFSGLAYAAYSFTVPTEFAQATLNVHWDVAPEYWIGMGNMVHNRWDWYSPTDSDTLPVTLADYRSGTTVLTAIVALGTTAVQLNALDMETTPAGPLRKMFFLHHSTGWGLIDGGNMRGYIDTYNTAHSETFELWDQGYNGDGPRDQNGNINGTLYDVPGDNTDVEGLWYLWTSGEADAVTCRNGFLADYDVIAFKSCFPNANVDSEDRLNNYETWYLGIRDFCDAHPEKIFVLMGFPPLRPEDSTNAENAARAREFSNWLCDPAFTAGHPNVFCFDLFDALASPDGSGAEANMLRPEYRVEGEPGNSHPNELANQTVGPMLAQFMIDAALAYTPPG